MTVEQRTRKAVVTGRDITEHRVAQFLPNGYHVVGSYESFGRPAVLIEGSDFAGWTLEDYVIPRLASGLLTCAEVIEEVRA